MRGKPAPKRDIQGDVKYNDVTIAKFINYVMEEGKKSRAEKIVYDSFELIKEKTKQDPRHVFNKAIKKVSPLVEVRGKRVGGANYQVPIEVSEERRISLGLRWLVSYARLRSEKGMENKLAAEIIDASNGMGASVKKRDDTHRMAEANKAYAHYRW